MESSARENERERSFGVVAAAAVAAASAAAAAFGGVQDPSANRVVAVALR